VQRAGGAAVLPHLHRAAARPDATIFGTADAAAKRDLLARAAALVFPILWDEPFGMVMIEAMACGTPVVALNRGPVAARTAYQLVHDELLQDGTARLNLATHRSWTPTSSGTSGCRGSRRSTRRGTSTDWPTWERLGAVA
jgi:hypothetical protein